MYQYVVALTRVVITPEAGLGGGGGRCRETRRVAVVLIFPPCCFPVERRARILRSG